MCHRPPANTKWDRRVSVPMSTSKHQLQRAGGLFVQHQQIVKVVASSAKVHAPRKGSKCGCTQYRYWAAAKSIARHDS